MNEINSEMRNQKVNRKMCFQKERISIDTVKYRYRATPCNTC